MKKFVCFILSVAFIFSIATPCCFATDETLKFATVNVFSTEYAFEKCDFYFKNGYALMDIADVVRYTRASFTEEKDKITVTHGYRKMSINTATGELVEDSITKKITVVQYNGRTLVHAYPLLTYLGADCKIEDNIFVIIMPKTTVWEGLVRTDKETYFTLETFGGEGEISVRLTLNAILHIMESGLSEALSDNAKSEALLLTLQVDPLTYDGGLDKKAKLDKKNNDLFDAMIAANDFSPETNEAIHTTDKLFESVVYEPMEAILGKDNDFMFKLKGAKGGLSALSGVSSYLSDVSANLSCTEDSVGIIDAFLKYTSIKDSYYIAAKDVREKVYSEFSAKATAARDAIVEKAFDKATDVAKQKIPIPKYSATLKMAEASMNVSVFVHKLMYGEHNAFIYSAAETSAINLLKLKNVLTSNMEKLSKQILEEKYSNQQSIEDFRLMNVMYYRTLIAANNQLEALIVAQGREKGDMKTVIDDLHDNNNVFAKNLYILTVSESKAFVDINELIKSNSWDSYDGFEFEVAGSGSSDDLAMFHLSLQGGQYAISGNYKYYTIQTGSYQTELFGDLYKENIKTGERTLLKKDTLAQNINVVGDKIFYTLYGNGPLFSGVHMISTDGSGYKQISDKFVHSLVADEKYVYYAEDIYSEVGAGIRRVPYTLDINKTETVVSSISGEVSDMNLIPGKLIYSENINSDVFNSHICIYDIATDSKQVINKGYDGILEIFNEVWIHDNYIYILKWHGHSVGQGTTDELPEMLKRDLYRYDIKSKKYEVCKLPVAEYEVLVASTGFSIGEIYSGGIVDDFEKLLPHDFKGSKKYQFIAYN